MTGKEKIHAAFSLQGTSEIPVVSCYTGILIRDHWDELTGLPWWYRESPNPEHQVEWRSKSIENTNLDWFLVPPVFISEEERGFYSIEEDGDEVYWIDNRDNSREPLVKPDIGGRHISTGQDGSTPVLPETEEEIDDAIPVPEDDEDPQGNGRDDVAREILKKFSQDRFPYREAVESPLWKAHKLWGFEGLMMKVATEPDLVEYACKRFLEIELKKISQFAALGAEAIWMEDACADYISPEAFKRLELPFLQRMNDEMKQNGVKCICYTCGNPAGKWDLLLEVGADALALEESKKNFKIDIEEVVSIVKGKCTLLGNVDSVGILQNGSDDELKKEVQRQIEAGKRNNGRFIMSTGSPITPSTPVSRVRLFVDIVHELG